jgi:transcriptional regulator with XRE-family HTH domain
VTDGSEIAHARRALGRQLAQFRQAAGYTQHQLAPHTLYVRSTIANVEIGRQNVPRDFWQRADAVLAAGGTLTAQYDDLVRLVRLQRREVAEASATDWPGGNEEGNGGMHGGLLDRTSAVLRQMRSTAVVSDGDIDRANVVSGADRLLRLFMQLDAEVGGDDLYEPMTRHVERLTRRGRES